MGPAPETELDYEAAALELLEDVELEDDEQDDIEEELFELSAKQDDFIFADPRFSGYGGGVGNGKSFAGCIKTHNHCMAQPGAFFLVGRRHATDLSDSTQKDFLALFEQEGSWSEKNRTFTYPNGSQVIFRHLEDLRKLTNMNLSGFWIDQAEEVDEQAYIFLNGRIRRKKGTKGFEINRREGFITFNMNGHDWIYRRFHKLRNPDGSPLPNPQDYKLIVATSLENKNLPQDYLDTIMSMPDEWVKRYVYGSWDVFAGQIFAEFNPFTHVLDAPFPIPNHWPRYRAIDHGQAHPTVCLWGATDYDGNLYIYQEYWQEDAPVSQHVREIKRMSQIKTTGGDWIMDDYDGTYIDPSTHAKTREKDGRKFSVADEYWEAGIMTMPAQNDVMAGIARVKEYLRINPKRWHPTKTEEDGQPIQGAPKVYIFPNCPHLIEELQQYKWKPPRYGVDQDRVERPVKNKDDAVDTFRYLIMSRPQTPDSVQNIDPRVLTNPVELARYCRDHGMSVDEFMIQRFGGTNRNSISHASGGIGHAESDINHVSSFNS